jgi:hypothetical protein
LKFITSLYPPTNGLIVIDEKVEELFEVDDDIY